MDPQAPQGLRSRNQWLRGLIMATAAGALIQLAMSVAQANSFRSQLPAEVANVFLAYGLLALTAGVGCLTAIVIAWRAAHREDARFLALFLSFVSYFWGALIPFLQVSVGSVNGRSELEAAITIGSASTGGVLTALVLGAAALLHFGAVFPTDRKRPGWLTDRRIWLVPLLIAAIDGLLTTADLLSLGVDPSQLPKPVLFAGIVYLLVAHVLLPIIMILFGMSLLVRNYRAANREDRNRALWIIAGFAAALGILFVAILLGQILDTLDATPSVVTLALIVIPSLAPLVIVIGMGIAVFFAGAFDPGLVIRKTTMYALLGLVATGLFALVENVVTATLTKWLNLPSSVGTFAGSIVVAALIIPLRDRLKPVIDRKMSAPPLSTPSRVEET